MDWTNFRVLWPKLKIMKSYLPQSVFSQIELVFRKPNPTRAQLSKIATLGESVGLQRNEIIAAVDAPFANPKIARKDRLTLYFGLIVITIFVTIGILFTWAIVDPESFPIPTYVPGSLYGSIQPQDFSSQILTPFVT